MQKKRIVLGVTLIVVIALLFTGVGYAAFGGTARTYNEDDSQTLAYMSVTPEDFDRIFTGDTLFDTYAYAGPNTAYAFDDGETVDEITIETKTYKAVELGTKDLTVLNNTGAAISKLNVAIKATGAVGSTDFVYIFKMEVAGGSTYYLVFDGDTTLNTDVVASIADASNKVITLTIYIGYVPNIYVPSTYIGPATANSNGYVQATYWKSGETYYSNTSGDVADPQPTAETFGSGTYYIHYASVLPYILPSVAPGDLLSTSFGIEVTDVTPAA